jgi:dUTP pyrophosphatase
MSMMDLRVRVLDQRAAWPTYQSPGAACLDLAALEGGTVWPGQVLIVPTGLAFEVPYLHVMMVYLRSSMAFKHGLGLANGTGIIDSDYRGEVKIALVNHTTSPVKIDAGQRIAQALVMPIPAVVPVEVDVLAETMRGEGGFGSTGK